MQSLVACPATGGAGRSQTCAANATCWHNNSAASSHANQRGWRRRMRWRTLWGKGTDRRFTTLALYHDALAMH